MGLGWGGVRSDLAGGGVVAAGQVRGGVAGLGVRARVEVVRVRKLVSW